MPRKSRIQPYVPHELQRRLAQYCAKRGVHESGVVEAALQQYLDGLSDPTLLFRRLDSVTRSVQRLQRDLTLQSEFLNQWVKVWFRNTPPLPEADKKATTAQAADRYRRMLERLAASVSAGRSFVDDLPKEELDPDAELKDDGPGPRGIPAFASDQAGQ